MKRKSSSPSKRSPRAKALKKDPVLEVSLEKIVRTPPKQKLAVLTPAKKIPQVLTLEPKRTPGPAAGRAERALKRKPAEPEPPSPSSSLIKSSPVVDQKKAKILARVARKSAAISPKPAPPPTPKQAPPAPKQATPIPKQGKVTFLRKFRNFDRK